MSTSSAAAFFVRAITPIAVSGTVISQLEGANGLIRHRTNESATLSWLDHRARNAVFSLDGS
jgi:hypothetical protein